MNIKADRGIAPIIVLGIAALALLGTAFLFVTHEPESSPATLRQETSAETIVDDLEIPSQLAPEEDRNTVGINEKIDVGPKSDEKQKYSQLISPTVDAAELMNELRIASGGVNPQRYDQIMRELDDLAARGLDAKTLAILRGMIAKLIVGGSEPAETKVESSPEPPEETPRTNIKPFWEFDPSKPEKGWYWARDGAPPACPEPLILPSPVKLDLVTAILYPGQVRGDGPEDFKPHGGFTLKAGNKNVELLAPMDGYLTSVAKFTDEFGLHYALTFTHPCGIQFGGGHFGALPPDIQAIIDKVPLKPYGDS
ncbi:MAG TPA: hypothetical protein VJH69_01935, partial [Candidatus Paceibacterota bacterium]